MIKPLSDRLVVEPLEAEQKTAAGIYIPDSAQEKPQKGKVIAVGPGKTADSGQTIKMEVSKDDIILYGKYSGTEISEGNKDYLIVKESDVLGIIK